MKFAISNTLIFILCFFSFALPVAPETRLVLFDFLAVWICINQYRVLARSPQVRNLVWLFFIYQCAMLVSTVVHGLPLINFVRRSYSVTFLLIEALAFYRLLSGSDDRRLLVLILGIMLGMCMNYFYPTDMRVKDLPIKFLLGVPVGVVIVAFLNLLKYDRVSSKLILSASLLAYSIYCMAAGSRANGGIFFVTSLLVWARFDIARMPRYSKLFPMYVVFGTAVVYLLSRLYTYAAISGAFGSTAQGIALFQSELFGNILLGGRPEIIVNLIAFFDSPLIGQGPIAENFQYLNLLSSMHVYSEDLVYGNPESMYHSMLFATAQEGGALAILFWLYVTYKIAFAMPIIIATQRRVAFVAVALFLSGVWNILFSPLIAYNRWIVAAAIGFSFVAYDERVTFLRMRRRSLSPTDASLATLPSSAHV